MIASQYQSNLLSINVFKSIPSGKGYLRTISDTTNSWRHSISAEGGYKDGAFSIRAKHSEMEEWLEDGLFRHIEVLDPSGSMVWEGFVNKVTITYGAMSITRGPFLELINDVKVLYTLERETDSGITSTSKETSWLMDLESVRKYGVSFQRALNAGAIADGEATRIRNMYLSEHKRPEAKQDISTTRHESNIIVDCSGYYTLLDKKVCQINVPNAGAQQEMTLQTTTASAKIKMALSSDANSFLNYTELLTNPRFETAGGGGADVFTGWTETASDGAIAQVSLTGQITTNYCCRLQAGASYNTSILQAVTVVPAKSYPFCFSTQGNGYQGRWRVYYGAGTNIIPISNTRISYNTSNRFSRVVGGFVVPAGVTSVNLAFYCPYRENAYAWWDDATCANWVNIDENTVEVKVKQKGNKTIWAIVKEVLSLGDTSDQRWLFGVYQNRTPHYHVAPTTYEYTARSTDNKITFYKLNGEEVKPYNVLPGKWMLITDLLVGTVPPTDLKFDPRAMFIEEVRYSSEEGVTFNAGRINQLTQRLGRLGITGISG